MHTFFVLIALGIPSISLGHIPITVRETRIALIPIHFAIPSYFSKPKTHNPDVKKW